MLKTVSRLADRIKNIRDKESVVYLLYFVALLFFLATMIDFSFRVNKTLDAVMIDLANPSERTPVSVSIEGDYSVRLFGDPSFLGQIRIDSIGITSFPTRPVRFDLEQGYGSLSYEFDSNIGSSQNIGFVRMNRTASNLIICLFVKHPERENLLEWAPSMGIGKVILFPKQDVERLKNKLYFYGEDSIVTTIRDPRLSENP